MKRSDFERRAQAFQANKSSAATENVQEQVQRIDALTRNSRASWFALLASLTLFGLSLMGFRHIDYFDPTKSVKLPFVDIPVSTSAFFTIAPPITAIVYAYFHLYLIRLWDALGNAPPSVGKMPLGKVVSPWLVIDAALYLRSLSVKEETDPFYGTKRLVEHAASTINFLALWGFGIFVLILASYSVIPLKNFALTGITTASVITASVFGISSLSALFNSLTTQNGSSTSLVRIKQLTIGALVMCTLVTVSLSVLSFLPNNFLPNRAAPQIASIDFAGVEIVPKPKTWMSYGAAKNAYLKQYCDSLPEGGCSDLQSQHVEQLSEDWLTLRRRQLDELPPAMVPSWLNSFLRANLTQVFWPNAQLESALLDSAILDRASMEQANLRNVTARGVSMANASMELSIFDDSNMIYSNFRSSNLNGSSFISSKLRFGLFRAANLQDADFRYASLNESDFSRANLTGADFRHADLPSVKFDHANLQGADFRGANLSGATFVGSTLYDANFDGANISGIKVQTNGYWGSQFENACYDEGSEPAIGIEVSKGTDRICAD